MLPNLCQSEGDIKHKQFEQGLGARLARGTGAACQQSACLALPSEKMHQLTPQQALALHIQQSSCGAQALPTAVLAAERRAYLENSRPHSLCNEVLALAKPARVGALYSIGGD